VAGGTPAFLTDALLSNDDLIHCWIADKLDSTLGSRPELTSTTVEIQGNMAVVQNMPGIIAMEVGHGLGVAMQNVAISGKQQAGGTIGSKEAKPYTQDQVATLLGFHRAKKLKFLMKMWRLFKTTKTPNCDHLLRSIKHEMLRWADKKPCWIKEGVYFDHKSLDEWGDSTFLYSSADKGISILKCRAPTSAHLEDLRRQEEIWDATKDNATYFKVTKQAKSKDVSLPAHNFGELWSNIHLLCLAIYPIWGGM